MGSLFQIAALQLIEQGKLSVDDPVSRYIPQFDKVVVLEGDYMSKETRPYRPAKEAITVARLLNHSSGLAYFTRNPEVSYSNPPCSSIKHGPTREATSERFIQLLQVCFLSAQQRPSLTRIQRRITQESPSFLSPGPHVSYESAP